MFASEHAMSAVELWSLFAYLTLSVEFQKMLPLLMKIVMWFNVESAVMLELYFCKTVINSNVRFCTFLWKLIMFLCTLNLDLGI